MNDLPGSRKRSWGMNRMLMTALGVAAWLFVGVKASQCSFTHDESLSYNLYVHQSFMDIVSYATPYTNNHILNTLMMKLWESCFGMREWALRLQSLLAFAAFLFFSARIVRLLPAPLAIAGFVLLAANPYLLDFFGLARGYGLSICFMMVAVWYLLRSLQARHTGYIALFNFAALLACCSNFSLINFYLAAIGSFYVLCLLPPASDRGPAWRKYVLRATGVNLALMLATTLILWEPLRKTHQTQALDFGGKTGFIADTVVSVVRASLYHIQVPDSLALILGWLIVLITLATGLYWIRAVVADRSSILRLRPLVLVNMALAGIAVLTIIQHILLHNDYFIGRFALFMFPLFILNTLFWLADCYQQNRFRKYIPVAVFGFGALMLAITLYNLNMHSYLDWEYDKDTKQAMAMIKAHHDRVSSAQHGRLGATWWFEPTANFYRRRWQMDWLRQVDRDDIKPDDIYWYSRIENVANTPVPKKLDTLYISAESGYVLMHLRERRPLGCLER